MEITTSSSMSVKPEGREWEDMEAVLSAGPGKGSVSTLAVEAMQTDCTWPDRMPWIRSIQTAMRQAGLLALGS
jgi:hypothetical protein